MKQVGYLERRLTEISNGIRASKMKNSRLANKLEENSRQVERGKQQVDQLQRRFHLLQRALVEQCQKKDKELARWLASLNFEQYNKQVALEGIKGRLQDILSELEAMKCRFSQRFVGTQVVEGRKGREASVTASPLSGVGMLSVGRHCCESVTTGRAKSGDIGVQDEHITAKALQV